MGVEDEQPGPAIGRGARRLGRADAARGTALVVDDDVGPQPLLQALLYLSGDGIDGSAWREGHDDRDDPAELRVLRCGVRPAKGLRLR